MAVDYDAAALAAARRYCGWCVTPAETVTLTLDGPGGPVLSLPTLHLTSVASVTEDGVAWDVADLRVSGRGQIRKRSGGWWTSAYASIAVTFTHGYASAPDFDAAVEQAAAALEAAGTRDDSSLKRKKIDDVEYEWFESASSYLNESLLAPYRILPSP